MNDIHQIKSPIILSIFDTQVPYVLAFLSVAVFALFVMRLYYSRKISQMKAKALSSVDTGKEEKVRQALERLSGFYSIMEEERFHELYLIVTSLIKETLSEVFDVKMKEMTTAEIAQLSLHGNLKKIVLDFLSKIDRMKFDDIQSEREDAEALYVHAKKALEKMQIVAQKIDIQNQTKAEKLVNK